LTKFMNKSFSVYANYAYVPKCSQCGKETNIFIQTIEGRLCQNCHEKNKIKRLEAKVKQSKMS
jgi:DNA-directed RNA polymerase subunit RPC12/RpoP